MRLVQRGRPEKKPGKRSSLLSQAVSGSLRPAGKAIERRAADIVAACKFASVCIMQHEFASKLRHLIIIEFAPHSELHAIRLRAGDAFSGTLPDQIAFKLTDGGQHMK